MAMPIAQTLGSFMSALVPVIGSIVAIAGTIGLLTHHDPRDLKALQINGGKPAIFHLLGQDMDKLHGLSMAMIDADTAEFTTDHFKAFGNASIYPDRDNDGYVHGELSFRVPGLEEPVESIFIAPKESQRTSSRDP